MIPSSHAVCGNVIFRSLCVPCTANLERVARKSRLACGLHDHIAMTDLSKTKLFLAALSGASIGAAAATATERGLVARLRVLRPSGRKTRRQRRLAAESRTIESDRLCSLGLLAAGVAHEINSPLTWMATNLRYAIDELATASPDLAAVRAALADAESGTDLVIKISRDLRVFARNDDEAAVPARMDIRRVVEAALRIAAPQIQSRACLVVDLHDVPPVVGIERKLMQVVINLVVNAAQALPSGPAGDHEIRVSTRPEAGAAVIAVGDSGEGVPAEMKRQIFAPLFTTKPEGTGLGLSISRFIVESFGGTISVEDAVPHGAIFSVRLPAAPPIGSTSSHSYQQSHVTAET